MVASVVAVSAGPPGLSASSHREAPLIAGDPRADNTDVYAFVSPDAPDTVSVVANWLPFSEPVGGPNFYPWAEETRYNINVDNDGDAVADLAYTWVFEEVVKPGGDDTFLINVGPFTSVNDDTLLRYQTYDLTVRDLNGTPTDESDDDSTLLLDDAIAAPSVTGPTSTPDYQALVDEAVASGTDGPLKSYAGQADDSFFLDLRLFDLLYGADATEVGNDTLAGYNVNTIALQLPKDALALDRSSADNPVIGIWSTTDRLQTVIDDNGTPDDPSDDTASEEFVQVSRLGNPLVNEVVMPLALKDIFNSVDPTVDATVDAVVEAVTNPVLPPIVNAVYGAPVPGDNNGDADNDDAGDDPRTDLVEIFLQGVSVANGGTGDPAQHPALAADLNSLGLNAGVDSIVPSEMLRLNMSLPPTAEADVSNLGVLGGDLQGFPNGRRLSDDVVDIALRVVEGAVYEDGLDPAIAAALAPLDSVDRNDRDFSLEFPYVALPQKDAVNNGTERTPRAPEFTSLVPTRVLETRTDVPSGQIGYTGPKPSAGTEIDLDVSGLVPDDATAVFLTVSAVNPDTNGFVTVYSDCDNPRPTAASLNPIAGLNVSNSVAAPLDDDGTVCIFTSGSTDLVADATGFLPGTSTYAPNDPQRVLETRDGVPGGQVGYTGAKPAAGETVTVQVTGVGTADLPADTAAVVLNVTSANSDGNGYVTAYPCGEDRPTTANLNLSGVNVRGNQAVSKVGDGGTVCLYTSDATDLIVDLQGSYPADTEFVPVTPTRLLETREGVGRIGYTGDKPIAGEVIEVPIFGRLGDDVPPPGTGTVFLNVAAIQAETNGFMTVFECGSSRPLAASGTFAPGANTSTLVAAPVGDGGRVCIFTSSPAHITADISGYFPGTQLVGD